MKDYSEHLMECRALLAAVSDFAMRKRYWAAAWLSLTLAREALRMSAALRHQRATQERIERRQQGFAESIKYRGGDFAQADLLDLIERESATLPKYDFKSQDISEPVTYKGTLMPEISVSLPINYPRCEMCGLAHPFGPCPQS